MPRSQPPASPPTLLGSVTADEAPLPATRSTDEALIMLGEMERGALSVLAREGLPAVPGLYRRDAPEAPWTLLTNPSTVEERWQAILNRPPDAGFHYLKLSDVARTERPDVAEVQSRTICGPSSPAPVRRRLRMTPC